VITIDPIWAQAGTVWVRGDILQGSGLFDAPKDVRVDIQNDTQAFLEIRGITIPSSGGGVTFNGIPMDGADAAAINTQIRGVNTANAPEKRSSGTTIPDTGTPQISVRNTFDPRDLNIGAPWPNITLLSTADGSPSIVNDNGSVDLEVGSGGSVNIGGGIRSADLSVIAGASVNIDGLTQYAVGGDAADVLGTATYGKYGTAPVVYHFLFGSITINQDLNGAGVVSAACTAGTAGCTLRNGAWMKDSFWSAISYNPALPPKVEADRIHISAEYVNVKGLIRSGESSLTLTLDQALANTADAMARSQSGVLNMTAFNLANKPFHVAYDTASHNFVVSDIKPSGGYIEIIGNVTSTGGGRIEALGGYGGVTILNQTSKGLELGRVDVSTRGAGVVLIVDKAHGASSSGALSGANSSGPYSTLYRYTEGGVEVTSSDGTNQVVTLVTDATQLANLTYNPAATWRYGWVTAVSQNVHKVREETTKSFIAWDVDSHNDSWDSVSVVGVPQYDGSGPYFYKCSGTCSVGGMTVNQNDVYDYSQQTLVLNAPAPERVEAEDSWGSDCLGKLCFTTTYYRRTVQDEGQKVLNTHDINAHYAIPIAFIGGAEGSVTVSSVGSVFLDDAISNPTGVTSVSSSGGSVITQGNGYVGGRRIVISASTGIGTEGQPLQTQVSDVVAQFNSTDTGLQKLNTPEYHWTSTQGTQKIAQGDTVYASNGRVYQYLLPGAFVNLGSANYSDTTSWLPVIALTQDVVKVGSAYYRYTGLAAQLDLSDSTQHYASNSAWHLVTARPSLSARTTSGDVSITELSGDLPIDQVVSVGGGNVTVSGPGAILVATGFEGLVSGGALNLNAGSGAAQGGGTRGIGTSGTPLILDSGAANGAQTGAASAIVNITAPDAVYVQEKAGNLLLDSLVTGGLAWVQVLHGSLLDANTEEVRDERTVTELLNGVWGDLRLIGTDAQQKIADAQAAYDKGKERDYLTFWTFRAQIGNDGKLHLTQAEKDYYHSLYPGDTAAGDAAITTLENSRNTQYATLLSQWTTYFGGTLPASYDPSFHYVRSSGETNALAGSIHQWTQAELLSLVSAGALKDVTDTTVADEQPNISAAAVTLLVDQNVGALSSTLVIQNDGHTFTTAERLALATAERGDVSYVGTPVSATVNFNGTARTITRSAGSWLGQGLQPGSVIQISGPNTLNGSGTYTIAQVTATTITLAAGRALATEAGRAVTLTPVIADPAFQAVGSATSATVTFAAATFNSTGGLATAATITRTDSGFFDTRTGGDGYSAGSLLRVAGASRNANAGGEQYRVTGVSSDGKTLTVSAAGIVTSATPVALSFQRGVTPAVAQILVVNAADVNLDSVGTVNATATSGYVLIGSGVMPGDSTKDLKLGLVSAAGEVRIKGDKNVLSALGAGATNVTGTNLVLESANGTIGTSTKALTSNITGTLTARASGGVWETEAAGDMLIASVYSQSGVAHLTASAGSILDGLTGAGNSFTKVKAVSVELDAAQAIGTAPASAGANPDYIELVVDPGTVTAIARNGGIYLNAVEGSLSLRDVYASGHDIDLAAQLSILDGADADAPSNPFGPDATYTDPDVAAGLPGVNVYGRDISLTARAGSIGELGNDVDVTASGVLNSSSTDDNTFVTSPLQDLALGSVNTATNSAVPYTAFITVLHGKLTNGLPAGQFNVTSGKVWLFASGDIGSLAKRLTTKVSNLEGQSTNGSVYIDNTGALVVGGINALNAGDTAIDAAGDVFLNAHSPIHFAASTHQNSITATTADNSADDNIYVDAGVTVQSDTFILFTAGDDVVMAAGSKLDAAGDITLSGDNVRLTSATVTTSLGNVSITAPGTIAADASPVTATAGTVYAKAGDSTHTSALTLTNGSPITGAAGVTLIATGGLTATGSSVGSSAAGITLTAGVSGSGNLTLTSSALSAKTFITATAPGTVTATGGSIGTDTGTVTLSAGSAGVAKTLTLDGAAITTNAGNVVVSSTGDMLLDNASSVTATLGTVLLAAGAASPATTGKLTVKAGSSVTAGGSATGTSTGDMSVANSPITSTAANIVLTSLGLIDLETSALQAATGIAGTASGTFHAHSGSITSDAGAIVLGAGTAGVAKTLTLDAAALWAKAGSISASSTGDMLLESGSSVTATLGTVTLAAGSATAPATRGSLTLTGASDVTAGALVTATATGDLLITGSSVHATAGAIALRAGDDLRLAPTGVLSAATTITTHNDDIADTDANGFGSLFEGSITAPLVDIHGGSASDLITLRPVVLDAWTRIFGEGGADTILLDNLLTIDLAHKLDANGMLVNGTAGQAGQAADTRTVQGLLAPLRNAVDIDGGDGSDAVHAILTGATDYLVRIHDTGTTGSDTVTLDGLTGTADDFLVRREFVALLQSGSANYERVNYDATIERLVINGSSQADRFIVDDTSAPVELNSGAGDDTIEFGQLFGSDRQPPEVALGDEMTGAGAMFDTERGWLSPGSGAEAWVHAGDGADKVIVNASQGLLHLFGEGGDDSFWVYASSAASPVGGYSIVGGGGTDTATFIGSDASDVFVIDKDGVQGGGLGGGELTIEKLQITGAGGDDHFYVLGTPAGAVTTIFGGTGSDTFDLTGDVAAPVRERPGGGAPVLVTYPPQWHDAASLAGPLVLSGAREPASILPPAVAVSLLPTEVNATPLPLPADDSDQPGDIDSLNVFDDGAAHAQSGSVGRISTAQRNALAALYGAGYIDGGVFGQVTGLGMGLANGGVAGGITYGSIEALDVLLGAYDDSFTIDDTTPGTLTLIQGGGGSDTLTVLSGGGAGSLIVLFGDTSQDGNPYNSTPANVTGGAREFTNPGDDHIDAGGAQGAVAIYGGRGDDTVIGSAFGDLIAGGSGNDNLNGGDGADEIHGDDGLNVDLLTRVVSLVSAPAAGDEPVTHDALEAGGDTIDGGAGNDTIFGDHGVRDGSGTRTTQPADGGDDTVDGGTGDDVILGGAGADTLRGGADHDVLIGDNGQVTASRIETTDLDFGGDDTILGGDGSDWLFGGVGADTLDGGAGDDIAVGDNGILYLTNGLANALETTDTSQVTGRADHVEGGSGDDVLVGGPGTDTITDPQADTTTLADGGEVTFPDGRAPQWRPAAIAPPQPPVAPVQPHAAAPVPTPPATTPKPNPVKPAHPTKPKPKPKKHKKPKPKKHKKHKKAKKHKPKKKH
jgi:Ca2+-binding RTX toxin-like protein